MQKIMIKANKMKEIKVTALVPMKIVHIGSWIKISGILTENQCGILLKHSPNQIY